MEKEKKTVEDMEEIPISNYRQYHVGIRGITPVIWNRLLMDLSKPKVKAKSQETPEEEQRRTWRDKLHLDPTGRVYWPSENVQEMIIGGAQYWGLKIGMRAVYKIIERGVLAEPMEVWDATGAPVYKDSDSLICFEKAVRRKDGQLVYQVRPMLAAGWTGRFLMHVWDSRLTQEIMSTSVRMSGQYNGIGDWRQFYGRFECVSFEEAVGQKVA